MLPGDAGAGDAGDAGAGDAGDAGDVGAGAGAELWTHLRLLPFCRAVWYLRCCRVAHGQVYTMYTAAAVVEPDNFLDPAGGP